MNTGSSYGGIGALIGFVLIVFLIFMVLRKLSLWYWRIDEIIDRMDRMLTGMREINENLKMAVAPPAKPETVSTPSGPAVRTSDLRIDPEKR